MRALVFDFDGVVLDTEGPLFTAWVEEFVVHGCSPLTVDEWSAEIGSNGALDPVALLRARAASPVDVDAMHARRRARRDALLEREVVLPGVVDWLDAADRLGIRVAIASSSEVEWVASHLDRLGLRSRFAHLACAGAALRPKPAPDTYLAACAALGVEPRAALAVEDSPHGLAAARAAGLACVAVPHPVTASLDLSAADVQLTSLADATLDEVLGHVVR